jgi:hypothetical protein
MFHTIETSDNRDPRGNDYSHSRARSQQSLESAFLVHAQVVTGQVYSGPPRAVQVNNIFRFLMRRVRRKAIGRLQSVKPVSPR